MRWMWSLRVPGTDAPEDVVVDAPPETSMASLAAALAVPAATLAAESPASAGMPTATLAQAAPDSGASLPPRSAPSAGRDYYLHWRGGPLAGRRVPLADGITTLGRHPASDIVLADPAVSRAALVIELRAGQARVRPCPNAHPLRRNGELVPVEGVPLGPADVVEVGGSVLSIGPAQAERGDAVRGADGAVAFNRPSRIGGWTPERRVTFPSALGDAGEALPMPWLMALMPLLLGAATAYLSHSPTMLMMGLASPVMMLGSHRSQRRVSRRRRHRAEQTWQAQLSAAHTALREANRDAWLAAWRACPDPATVACWCQQRGARLFERRVGDPDALSLRIGLAQLPSAVAISGGEAAEMATPTISPAPVCVDLRTHGVLGVAGPPGAVRAAARWAMMQLAALRSPRDLRLVLLCGPEAEADWAWARWLPHLHTDVARAPAALIGNSERTRAARLRELSNEILARQHLRESERDAHFDDIVVIIDGARAHRGERGVGTVLRDGPAVGVHAICLDTDRVRLPEQVSAEVVIDSAAASLALLEASGQAALPRVLLDGIDPALAEAAARALAPVRHVGGEGDSRELPAAVRLVELLRIDLDDAEALAARWQLAGRNTAVRVGAGGDGPVRVDLALDGPHALVAGTTGAGKSEFLQSLVAALALANRPDALTFVLIDYKGASAFADCAELPHTVGLVTNLDARETQRALRSLDAELERRERVLRELGAKDTDAAWERDPQAAAEQGLARLVLVIDEFAELVHALPDFVTGLIRIARVGRSLGVHLILATQRPAGVVTAEMQANLALRVALRMADKENSQEILSSPLAALISPTTPGRGYLRGAAGAAPLAFQAARVSGPRSGSQDGLAAPRVHRIGWADLGEPLPDAVGERHGPAADSDLHALVGLLHAAAGRLGVRAPAPPWLPPLPDTITIRQLRGDADASPAAGEQGGGLLLGLLDRPDQQCREPLRYRVGRDGHALIIGGARSGRSSLLRTMIAELARCHPPGEVHLYGLDGGGALAAAARLPHCGAIVASTEAERAARLLDRLTAEITRRQQLLTQRGYSDLAELRADPSAPPEPYLLVMIDRWEGVLANLTPEQQLTLREQLTVILRGGAATGVALVITGDRALLSERLAAFVETRYLLRLTDREDYRLAGIRPADLPERIPPGRAYLPEGFLEAQFALLSDDASGAGQLAALHAVIDGVAEPDVDDPLPLRLDPLPAEIDAAEADRLPDALEPPAEAPAVLVGVGGDRLSRFRIDFADGPGFLIAGAPRSGRSGTLTVLAAQFAGQGVPTLAIAPRPSAARRELARSADLLDAADGSGAARLSEWAARQERCAVLVDDAEALRGSDLDDALVELARSRRAGTLALVVATDVAEVGAILRGVVIEAKRRRCGLVLSASNPLEGAALGPVLPRNLVGRAPAGRAALLVAGTWYAVQIPRLARPHGVAAVT